MSKNNSILITCLFLLSLPAFITGQSLVKDVKVNAEQATFEMLEKDAQSLLIEIAGPAEYYFKQEIDVTSAINISNHRADGEVFPDGQYSLQVTPIIKLEKELLDELVELRNNRDALAIQQFREQHNLPENVEVYNYNFSIKNGKFVYSKLNEKAVAFDRELDKMGIEHPDLYASLNPIQMSSSLDLPNDNSAMFAQVFTQDVIIQGSLCVGIDCSASENFGFDTQRLKENNLRIHFDDTSVSASFPSNDWRITINDSTNGGQSYFGIDDATSGRRVFKLTAGAPANSLTVDDSGDVGIGVDNAVVELHIRDGDTPTTRLEQDGSSGFGLQTWDIAGNETNFFVRDVTNGSLLPFKIKPGAPTNSLFVAADGKIGLGTQSPGHKLHVESGNVYVKNGNVGIKKEPTVPLDVMGNTKFTGTHIQTGDASFFATATGGVTVFSSAFASVKMGAASHLLELSADDAVKPNGGSWTAPSDRRLKNYIGDFTDGLETVLNIKPVRYKYNGKMNMPTDQEFIGVFAQDMQAIAPYTVKKLNPGSDDDYLAFDVSSVTYMLVNAVKEQQNIINQQKEEIAQLSSQVAEIADLKKMMATLSQQVAELTNDTTNTIKSKNVNADREE